MTTSDIKYSTTEEQLEKLKTQGLIISDKNFAVSHLTYYGYSNLIKSYRKPYVVIIDGKLKYRSGVTFEQIASIYELDKNIRNTVMAAMQDLEEHFKELSADVIANSFGTNQDDYLMYKRYQNKRKSAEKFRLGHILDDLRKKLQSPKDPIRHYYNKYGVVPPWILFKSVFFSTMVNFIDQFKKNEQTQLMHRLLDFENLNIPEYNARILMMDILFVAMEYRNNAAHGGRMYDFRPSNTIRAKEIFGDKYQDYSPSYTELIELLRCLRYQKPYYLLQSVLEDEINRHCKMFPQDVTYLGQLLNINIRPTNVVFTTNNSKIFHSNPSCSGIKNVIEYELNEAIKKGYSPCKRCCSK